MSRTHEYKVTTAPLTGMLGIDIASGLTRWDNLIEEGWSLQCTVAHGQSLGFIWTRKLLTDTDLKCYQALQQRRPDEEEGL